MPQECEPRKETLNVANFSFLGKKEVVKAQRSIPISPEQKGTMENICAAEGVPFTVDFVGGLYEFSVDEDLYPRLEKYFMPAEKELPEQERKPVLGEQIGAAERKTGPGQQATQARNRTHPGTGTGRTMPRYAPVEEVPNEAPEVSKDPLQVDPKELTKDFGVLTIEEQRRVDERQAKVAAEKKPKKKRVKSGRDNQVKTRLTDTEMKLFSERVKASGLKQGDFMRECLLHEEVTVRSLTDIDAQAFGKLMEMSSDLGRIGGLIKGTVMANKDEFGLLSPAEKAQLEALIRELNAVKEDLLKVVQGLYGDS